MTQSEAYKTTHWKKLRKSLVTNNLEAVCVLCGKRKWKVLKKSGAKRSQFAAHLHHLHYDNLGHELVSDVVILCPSCHSLLHDISNRKTTPGFINDLQEVVERYIKELSE